MLPLEADIFSKRSSVHSKLGQSAKGEKSLCSSQGGGGVLSGKLLPLELHGHPGISIERL